MLFNPNYIKNIHYIFNFHLYFINMFYKNFKIQKFHFYKNLGIIHYFLIFTTKK